MNPRVASDVTAIPTLTTKTHPASDVGDNVIFITRHV